MVNSEYWSIYYYILNEISLLVSVLAREESQEFKPRWVICSLISHESLFMISFQFFRYFKNNNKLEIFSLFWLKSHILNFPFRQSMNRITEAFCRCVTQTFPSYIHGYKHLCQTIELIQHKHWNLDCIRSSYVPLILSTPKAVSSHLHYTPQQEH